MVKSNKKPQYKKPHPDFPLTPHRGTGRWCKKVLGRLRYFGRIQGDEKGQAALSLWLEQKDDLLAGREPRPKCDGLTVAQLCDEFLNDRRAYLASGELSPRTFRTYHRACAEIVKVFGKHRRYSDLAPTDFATLRARFATGRAPASIAMLVTIARMVFEFAFDQGLAEQRPRFGKALNRPTRKSFRLARAAKGPRLLEAHELRKMLTTAEPPLAAMILLGLNCAFGASDCANLPLDAIDFATGWVSFPRKKTGIGRRVPLWPETIRALQDAIRSRPAPANEADKGLVFLTQTGLRLVRYNAGQEEGATLNDTIGPKFKRLAAKLGINHRGATFYSCRRCFQTISEGACDAAATGAIMGHVDTSMAAHYRERMDDQRVLRVTGYVRAWLFGDVAGDELTTETGDDQQQQRQATERPKLRLVGA